MTGALQRQTLGHQLGVDPKTTHTLGHPEVPTCAVAVMRQQAHMLQDGRDRARVGLHLGQEGSDQRPELHYVLAEGFLQRGADGDVTQVVDEVARH